MTDSRQTTSPSTGLLVLSGPLCYLCADVFILRQTVVQFIACRQGLWEGLGGTPRELARRLVQLRSDHGFENMSG